MNAKLIIIFFIIIASTLYSKVEAQIQPERNYAPVSPVPSPPTENEVYSAVEVIPSFPGGLDKLTVFLNKNINNEKAEAPGRINVTFVVEKNGSLSDIRAIGPNKNSHAAEEAIRVMKLSPKWKHGTQNGKPVRVQYTIPVIFK